MTLTFRSPTLNHKDFRVPQAEETVCPGDTAYRMLEDADLINLP